MSTNTCTCPAALWHLALERERFARYTPPVAPSASPEASVTLVAPITPDHSVRPRRGPSPAARKQRDKDFYDAGRYAAGARDSEAVEAYTKLGKLQKKGNL